jgi:hypothetical protein
MPEKVIYMRGDVFQQEARDFAGQEFADVVRTLLNLGTEALAKLTTSLNSHVGFIRYDDLGKLVHSIASDVDRTNAVFGLMVNLNRHLQDTGMTAEEFAERLPEVIEGQRDARAEAGSEAPSPLQDEEIEKLTEIIPQLLGPTSAMSRLRKMERLTKATGLPLDDLQIICDLRPVFDDSRVRVEGMLPITTLKVVATGVDGLPVGLEARLSFDQLVDLGEKAKVAMLKLKSMKELLAQHNIPTSAK